MRVKEGKKCRAWTPVSCCTFVTFITLPHSLHTYTNLVNMYDE